MSADIAPDKPKLFRVTKLKVLFLFVLFLNFNLFESSADTETGLLRVFLDVYLTYLFGDKFSKYAHHKTNQARANAEGLDHL